MTEVEDLQRRLARAQSEIRRLEALVEDRTRSFQTAKDAEREASNFLERVISAMESALLVLDREGKVCAINPAGCRLLMREEEEVLGTHYSELIRFPGEPGGPSRPCVVVGQQEVGFLRSDGSEVPVLYSGVRVEGDSEAFVCVGTDLTEKKQLEVDLRHAHKLQSVGHLAAGIAHEINTPVQFVGDSVSFLEDAQADMNVLLDAYRELRDAAAASGAFPEQRARIAESEETADLEFLVEEVPAAFRRASDGVDRIARIVCAMKEFAHPGGERMSVHDLNDAVEKTLTVANNEYKYVADVDLALGELPLTHCFLGDVNQVVLNLVVNAAHAIKDKGDGRGRIGVRTYVEDGFAVIAVSDTGAGIPAHVQPHIFDPFFTTKPVGVGTGQGLAITHRLIVEKHSGEVSFDTEPGVGTTFYVRLPLQERGRKDAA